MRTSVVIGAGRLWSMRQLIATERTGPAFVDDVRSAWDSGDAVLPLDPRLPTAARKQLAERMAAGVIIELDGTRTTTGFGQPVEDGDAVVVVTSGTTGEPKGVVHTHQSLVASATRTTERLDVTVSDTWLCCLPVAHIGGLSVITRALLTDTPLVVHPSFDAERVTRAGAEQGVTLVSLVTAAMQRIDSSQFRVILLGGAAPPDNRPFNAIATYGMTETGSGIVYDTTPLRDVELRIGESDEIYVRTPTLFRCYRDGGDPKVDGWYATGDSGSMQDGVLHVHGRLSDVIITGGEKVWPTQVEDVLRTHPLVNDVRVYGEPDGEWGERVVAELELTAHEVPLLDELREHVKHSLPPYCAPKRLEVTRSLRRTQNGKIIRERL